VSTNRRLSQLQALSGGVSFQNLNYTYDNVDNITQLSNNLRVDLFYERFYLLAK
jgi:hypothetical protein